MAGGAGAKKLDSKHRDCRFESDTANVSLIRGPFVSTFSHFLFKAAFCRFLLVFAKHSFASVLIMGTPATHIHFFKDLADQNIELINLEGVVSEEISPKFCYSEIFAKNEKHAVKK